MLASIWSRFENRKIERPAGDVGMLVHAICSGKHNVQLIIYDGGLVPSCAPSHHTQDSTSRLSGYDVERASRRQRTASWLAAAPKTC
jgi:hypothetical protein